VKYRPCTESTINNCSIPTLGFGKVLDASLPYFRRHPFAWPASLQIILKNDAKWSFSEPRRDMFCQRFQTTIGFLFMPLSQAFEDRHFRKFEIFLQMLGA